MALLRRLSLKDMMVHFETEFIRLKSVFKDGRNIQTHAVIEVLAGLSACNGCNQFDEGYLNALRQATDHSELIGKLDFSMNFLSYHLLEYLAGRFKLETLQVQIKTYKSELPIFLEGTLLSEFCMNLKTKKLRLCPAFEEVIIRFSLAETVKLETVVGQFQRDYCAHYKLKGFAMIFAHGLLRHGSPPEIEMTWFVPASVTNMLKDNNQLPKDTLKMYYTKKLTVAGECVYRVTYRVSVYILSIITSNV